MRFLTVFLSSTLLCSQVVQAGPATEGGSEETISAPEPPHGSLRVGAASLDVAFPNGGSFTGTNAVGGRFFLTPSLALGIYAQFSYDKAEDLTAYGTTVRGQAFVLFRSRASLYLFAQASAGQTKKGGKEASSLSETQAGGAAGMGVEIFLLPELSTSVDVGLGGTATPASRTAISTGTSQLALHYFLGEE